MTHDVLAQSAPSAAPALPAFTQSRRRVLVISTNLGLGGGAEEQVAVLSAGLASRGWEVRIVSLLPPSPLTDELAASGVRIDSLDMRRGLPDPRALRQLLAVLRNFQPQVVHSHMTHANLLARVARIFYRGPVWINTLHGMTMQNAHGQSSRMIAWGYRLTGRLADLTTVVSTPARVGYVANRTVSAQKIAVQYNGVDCERLAHRSAGRAATRKKLGISTEFVWLAAGRLQPVKDYPTMLRAFAELRHSSTRENVLLICGGGEEEGALRALAADLEIGSAIRFLGMRRDVPELMGAADAFVLSSRTEGLPMALLEASACGLPIAATSVGGTLEIVVNAETGYLAPPEDPPALAAAMIRLAALTDADRAAMSEAARARTASKFDRESVLDSWEQIYRELLESNRQPRKR